MMILRIVQLSLSLLASTAASSPLSTIASSRTAASAPRLLEDAGDDGTDFSQYDLQSGVCFRMKIAENNDDDGNSYFYNGAYRAQYSAYVAFQLCDHQQGSGSSSSNSECRPYVSDLATYMEETVQYMQNLCNTCQETCRRALRRLENQQDDDGAAANNNNVDCSTCSSVCRSIQSSNGADESDYLECQEAAEQTDDGLQLYTAPQCEDGSIVIGQFYDDECTIKASKSLEDFSYATFGTIQSTPLQCQYGEACDNLVDASTDCSSEESKLCRAAAKASRVVAYHKKSLWKKIPVTLFVVCALFLTSVFLFLSYTYYVRHKYHHHHDDNTKKTPMAELDGECTAGPLPDIS